MSGDRMRSRIGGCRHISTLPPRKQQPCYDHNQNDLQHEAENGCKAGHSAEQSVSEQQTKEAGAEKARRQAAQQSTAEETRPRRGLADRAGRLSYASLDRRGSIGRRARGRRRREGPHASASTRKPTAGAGIGISGDENERCRNRGKSNHKPASKHRVVSPRNMARIEYVCARRFVRGGTPAT
jgi:hypothetical protein